MTVSHASPSAAAPRSHALLAAWFALAPCTARFHDPYLHDPYLHDPYLHDPYLHGPYLDDPSLHDPYVA